MDPTLPGLMIAWISQRNRREPAMADGEDERATIYARQKEAMSNFAGYEKSAAPREIPVILLDPVA
jgi:hypothetical protein